MLLTYLQGIGQVSFLNGDFETNTAVTDRINITNSQFNNYMTGVTAFGNYNGGGANGGDMDIITSNGYCGPAQNGNWYVALTGSGSDAIALKLSTSLVPGHTYNISFYDRFGYMVSTSQSFPFQIGLSTTDSTFGSPIYIGSAPDSCAWTQRIFSFTPTSAGQYITVQLSGGTVGGTWCHVDNFSIVETTGIESAHNSEFTIYPDPAGNELRVNGKEDIRLLRILDATGKEIHRQNNNKTISLMEFQPGIYFLEIYNTTRKQTFRFVKL
jgi:hypothetical protein